MPDEQTDGAPLQTLAAGARQFSYRAAGTGEPLVLLHGIGSNAGSWAGQLRGLSETRQVIAWDAPGYGGSTPLDAEAPAVEDYAAALAAFLDALEIPVCDLVGHSLGALMAGRFAAGRPERVRRLILASCACGYRMPPEGPRPATIQSRLDDIDGLGPAGLANKRSANLLSDAGRDRHLETVRAAMRQVTPGGYRQATLMLAQGDLMADAALIRCPTLVICGSEDRVTPEGVNRPVAEAIPDAHYLSLPDAGHALYVEQADAFNAAVGDFLGAS